PEDTSCLTVFQGPFFQCKYICVQYLVRVTIYIIFAFFFADFLSPTSRLVPLFFPLGDHFLFLLSSTHHLHLISAPHLVIYYPIICLENLSGYPRSYNQPCRPEPSAEPRSRRTRRPCCPPSSPPPKQTTETSTRTRNTRNRKRNRNPKSRTSSPC